MILAMFGFVPDELEGCQFMLLVGTRDGECLGHARLAVKKYERNKTHD